MNLGDKARDRTEAKGIARFFASLRSDSAKPPATAVALVTHLLPDRPFFIEALAEDFEVIAIFAKPKSRSEPTAQHLKDRGFPIFSRSRADFSSGEVVELLRQNLPPESNLVLLDIGGYFVDCLDQLASVFGQRLRGVVEDTENGQQKYERLAARGPMPCPVLSVARSPLKVTEDYLVGQAVVHSAEHLIRLAGQVLGGKTAVVFGFGKIGRSVATNLRSRGVDVKVIDTDPVRQVEAMCMGFRSMPHSMALASSHLIVGATGNLSLSGQDWERVRPGAFVFTVTSSDDELDTEPLNDQDLFEKETLAGAPHVAKYSTDGTYFYLLNDGNAVNFLHNAVVGDYIYLVQAEIREAALVLSVQDETNHAIGQLPYEHCRDIADAWLKQVARQ